MTLPTPKPGARRRLRCVVSALALLAVACGAHAADMLITAEFRPSALEPGRNTFTNTTPPGSYCQWHANNCQRLSDYIVDLPVNIISKTYLKGDDRRKRLYFHFPGARKVIATNETGASIEVDVAISSMSAQLSPGGQSNPAFTYTVGEGCQAIAAFTYNNSFVRFAWDVRNPQAPQPCHSVGQAGEWGFTGRYATSYLGVGLRITTASPLTLENGRYRGQLQYSIGSAGADIDLGDDVEVTDSVIVMNFEFLVEHDFKVERAPGTDTVVLQPSHGWAEWVQHGRAPTSLRQELPFLITSSGGFSVRLECGYLVDERCAIRSENGDEAAFDVGLTIPGLYEADSHSPVVDYPLVAAGVPPRFEVKEYLHRRSSRLGFSVSGEPLRRMLDMPGSRWRGDVTVVFDAAP